MDERIITRLSAVLCEIKISDKQRTLGKVRDALKEEVHEGFPRLAGFLMNVPPWDRAPNKVQLDFILSHMNSDWCPLDYLVGKLDTASTLKLRSRESGGHRKGRASSGGTSAMSLRLIRDGVDAKTTKTTTDPKDVSVGVKKVKLVGADLLGRISGRQVYLRTLTCRNLAFAEPLNTSQLQRTLILIKRAL